MPNNRPFAIPTGLQVTFEDKDYSGPLAALLNATNRLGISDEVLSVDANARKTIKDAEAGRRVGEAGIASILAAAPPEWIPHISRLLQQGKSTSATVRVTRDLVLPVANAGGKSFSEVNLKGYECHLDGVDKTESKGAVAFVRNPPQMLTMHKYINDKLGESHISVPPAALEAAKRSQNNQFYLHRLQKEVKELQGDLANAEAKMEMNDACATQPFDSLRAARSEDLKNEIAKLQNEIDVKKSDMHEIETRILDYQERVTANPAVPLEAAVMSNSIEAALDGYEESLEAGSREDVDYNLEASQNDYEKTAGYMIYGDQRAAAREREDEQFEREYAPRSRRVDAAASDEQHNALMAFYYAKRKDNVAELDIAITACIYASTPEVNLKEKVIDALADPYSSKSEIASYVNQAPQRSIEAYGSLEAAKDAAKKVYADGISGLDSARNAANDAMKRVAAERGLKSSKADQMLSQAKNDGTKSYQAVKTVSTAGQVAPAKEQNR